VALDPAMPMLSELRSKVLERQVQVVAGEGARLPFAGGSFDVVILARILYLMSDWQVVLRETYDVLKPGGCLSHEWGNGQADEAWVQIREKARALFQHAGIDSPFHPGARTETEVEEFVTKLGFVRSYGTTDRSRSCHDVARLRRASRKRRVVIHLECAKASSGIVSSPVEEMVRRDV
jgi:SAM-dependent methyltransferase